MAATIATLGLIGAIALPAADTAVGADVEPPPAPIEITRTPLGRDLARRIAARHLAAGMPVKASDMTVWEVGQNGFFVGRQVPDELRVSVVRARGVPTRMRVSFAVGAGGEETASRTGGTAIVSAAASVTTPSWAFLDAGCFARLGGGGLGFLDACYSLHRLVNESNAKDFYKLEQYGTLSAGIAAKIYNGWMSAVRASGSSTMQWVDWSPRGNVKGGCQNLTLKVEALGVSFVSPAYFCENNIPTKYEAAGSFRMEWSCGCIYPFGQPYPNSREIDYLQTVSVANGGSVRWTLSAGYLAR
ncbi:MAG: hypothetical protein ACTS8Z_04225 [Candidatus Limnocylindrales bacterium]